MIKRLHSLTLLSGVLYLTVLLAEPALAASMASQARSTPVMVDLGAAPETDEKDIMISLALPNRAALETFVASTVDPASPNFHKFLKPEEFAARFGQPQAVIDRVTTNLAAQGITVTHVYSNKLMLAAHGSNAHLAAAFATPIHVFATSAATFQKPVGRVAIPPVLQDVVIHVAGLGTAPLYRSHLQQVPAEATPLSLVALDPRAAPVAGSPGTYSVGDLATRNHITPLYAAGINGSGTTLGIMTLATFKPADIGVYWGWAGLSSGTSRITTINVGTGQTADGADETTVDVEQSGGVAPGANVRVYVAANTDAGVLALYTQAITENLCDTLSISWGTAEEDYDPAVDLPPFDALFLQAASQGTPISAASGDQAAYDINGEYPYPDYTSLLSLDFPSSSPYVVSAGGTTLPVTLKFPMGTIINPSERAWGWDYLRNYIVSNSGQAAYYAGFPSGGGGGISVVYPLPGYQKGLAGVLATAPGQSMFCLTSPSASSGAEQCTPGTDVMNLPSGFAGRNSPDVSLNADPETGYALYYDGRWSAGSGGTSFVAPQLNGIFALMTQKLGHRVGWPHPQLYSLFKAKGHTATSPFRAVTAGTNLFYQAGPNYNPAVGLGTLDVTNLANALK